MSLCVVIAVGVEVELVGGGRRRGGRLRLVNSGVFKESMGGGVRKEVTC